MKGGRFKPQVRQLKEKQREEEVGKYMLVLLVSSRNRGVGSDGITTK